MKRWIIGISALLMLSFTTVAQPIGGEIYLGLPFYYGSAGGFELNGPNDYGNKFYSGLEVQIFADQVFSLDYKFNIGGTVDGSTVLNGGFGQVGSVWLMSESFRNGIQPTDWLLMASVVGFLLPNGISGHLPLADFLTLSAFTFPLNLDMIYEAQQTRPRVRASYEVGARFNIFLNAEMINIQPTVSYMGFYRKAQEHYWNFGLTAMIRLKD